MIHVRAADLVDAPAGDTPVELRARAGSVLAVRSIGPRTDPPGRSDARLEAELLERFERLAGVGTVQWDLVSGDASVSARCVELLGAPVPPGRAKVDSLWSAIHEADRVLLDDALRSLLAGTQAASIRVRSVRPDGVTQALSIGLEVCRWHDGVAVAVFGTVQACADQSESDAKIKRLVCYDALTGLPNRLLFREQVNYALRRAARDRSLMAMLSLDVDNFRRINDTHGHELGDRVLKMLSARIGRCVRSEDVIAAGDGVDRVSGLARLGGDEFAILLSRVSEPQDAARVARRILETAAVPMKLGDDEIYPALSIGISLYPWDAADGDELIRCADTALGHAKEAGRNRAQFYSKSMNTLAADRLALETGLRKAIEQREFVLHYQPRVDGETRRILSNEALIRWMHPERGLVAPGGFIAAAEQSRLIVPIGDWVLQEACRQNRFWQTRGLPPAPVSVNISAIQFRHAGFASSVRRALETSGLDPVLLELELTESTLMEDADTAAKILLALKELGVRLSIDDFGTGFSSLAYLKVFPADALKVDRSFVNGLPGDAKNASIACAIIDLAGRLGMEVVAEGVETEAQRSFLAANGCREMQGFLFARPMEPVALELKWRAGESVPQR